MISEEYDMFALNTLLVIFQNSFKFHSPYFGRISKYHSFCLIRLPKHTSVSLESAGMPFFFEYLNACTKSGIFLLIGA